jgi:hypothetical protein
MADDPISPLAKSPMFWHLDDYATRAAADADKGPRSTVVESLGKVWLRLVAGRDVYLPRDGMGYAPSGH